MDWRPLLERRSCRRRLSILCLSLADAEQLDRRREEDNDQHPGEEDNLNDTMVQLELLKIIFTDNLTLLMYNRLTAMIAQIDCSVHSLVGLCSRLFTQTKHLYSS